MWIIWVSHITCCSSILSQSHERNMNVHPSHENSTGRKQALLLHLGYMHKQLNVLPGLKAVCSYCAISRGNTTKALSSICCFHGLNALELCATTKYVSCLNRHIEGILPEGPYLPCVSMAGMSLLAGYHLYELTVAVIHSQINLYENGLQIQRLKIIMPS